MRLWPKSLKWRAILLTLIALAAVIATVLYQWGWPIQRYVADQLNVAIDRDSAHPVIRGLSRGEIRAGSSVEELIAAHPPTNVTRYDRFVTLEYKNALAMRALNGKLVYAENLTWGPHIVYFNTLSLEEDEEYETSLNADKHRRQEDQMAPHRAIAGVAGHEAYERTPGEERWRQARVNSHRAVAGVAGFKVFLLTRPDWPLSDSVEQP